MLQHNILSSLGKLVKSFEWLICLEPKTNLDCPRWVWYLYIIRWPVGSSILSTSSVSRTGLTPCFRVTIYHCSCSWKAPTSLGTRWEDFTTGSSLWYESWPFCNWASISICPSKVRSPRPKYSFLGSLGLLPQTGHCSFIFLIGSSWSEYLPSWLEVVHTVWVYFKATAPFGRTDSLFIITDCPCKGEPISTVFQWLRPTKIQTYCLKIGLHKFLSRCTLFNLFIFWC